MANTCYFTAFFSLAWQFLAILMLRDLTSAGGGPQTSFPSESPSVTLRALPRFLASGISGFTLYFPALPGAAHFLQSSWDCSGESACALLPAVPSRLLVLSRGRGPRTRASVHTHTPFPLVCWEPGVRPATSSCSLAPQN